MRLPHWTIIWFTLLAGPALAQGDPIMPLDQVERGMQCDGRSVFRGTTVETFNVEILDVIEPSGGFGAGILFRAYGPPVEETGLGFGFSGSPIYCPDSNGTMRVIGAVSMGIEDYGNDVALATPIEDMLGLPAEPPPDARPATRAERNAEPWTTPMMVAGAGRAVRGALWSAARKAGVPLIHSPATASQVATGTDLVPGSAVAASLSSGAIGLNSIGTVTYRDGDRLWAFGHPLDSAGERSLLMQGAFVHHVVGNPNPPGFNIGTYKLASAGDLAGTLDFDGTFAVSGELGALPTTIPVVVDAAGPAGDLGKATTLVADESPLNHPSGFAALSLTTSIAVSDRVFTALGSSGGRSFGRMCMRIDIEERDKPMRFCNRYIGDGQFLGGTEIAMGGDATTAATLVERFDRFQLHVERLRVRLEVGEGLRFAELRGATAPRRVRPGERIPVRITYQLPREKPQSSTFSIRVPPGLKPGRRMLRISGSGADPGDASLEAIFGAGLSPEDAFFFFGDGPRSPTTVTKLARAIGDIHRYDGIRATFRKPRRRDRIEDEFFDFFGLADIGFGGRAVFRHDELRIGGTEKVRVRVLPG
jgi:hypothetical protein